MCDAASPRRTCRCITELLGAGGRGGSAAGVVVGELAEQVAELALTTRCRHGQVDLLEVDDQAEQTQVERSDDQVEHLTRGLALARSRLRQHGGVEPERVHAVLLHRRVQSPYCR